MRVFHVKITLLSEILWSYQSYTSNCNAFKNSTASLIFSVFSEIYKPFEILWQYNIYHMSLSSLNHNIAF